MKDIALAIATCGFIVGSVNTTGLPEFLYVLAALLTVSTIDKK